MTKYNFLKKIKIADMKLRRQQIINDINFFLESNPEEKDNINFLIKRVKLTEETKQ